MSAFIHWIILRKCGDVLKILSLELKVENNRYDITEAYMKYNNEQSKIIKEEYESKLDECRKK